MNEIKKNSMLRLLYGTTGFVVFGLFVWLAVQEAQWSLMMLGAVVFTWGVAGQVIALSQARKVAREFEKKSMVDERTGALSKTRILEAIERELKSAKRKNEMTSIVLVEASNIMEINERFDRIEGDGALSAIALASQKCLRDTDYLGRWGGLIFCALLPETSQSEACLVTDRVKKSLEEIERSHSKGLVRVKFRLVAATWQVDESVVEMMGRAEAMLVNEKIIESKG